MTTTDVRPETHTHEPSPVSDVALWTSMLLGPFVFLLNLEVNYVLVDWACNTGNTWALHVAHFTALVTIAIGTWLGVVLWRWADRDLFARLTARG